MKECKMGALWGDTCRKMEGCYCDEYYLKHEDALRLASQEGKTVGLEEVNRHLRNMDRPEVKGCTAREAVRAELKRRQTIIASMPEHPSH